MLLLIFVNLVAGVRGFGESEYFFSIVKVLAVVAFLCIGILLDLGIPNGKFIGFENWKENPFKNGISGIFDVFLIAFFAFGGTELIGMAAAEADDPKNTLPRAISQTLIRICLFYIGSILIMGLLISNSDPRLLDPNASSSIVLSPFTIIFSMAGIPGIDHIVNLVVVFAILSAANSAMYAASRTLMGLSFANQAPAVFGTLYNGVPIVALVVTVLFGSLAFAGNVLGGIMLFLNILEGLIFNFLIKLSGASGRVKAKFLTHRYTYLAVYIDHTPTISCSLLGSR